MKTSLVLVFSAAWVVQGALFTVDPLFLLAAGATNVTVTSVLPAFSAGFSYRMLAAGGAQFPCARVDPTHARCELNLAAAADYAMQLQALPSGGGQTVTMTSFTMQVYPQPAVAAVSPTRLPRSGGQLLRVLFASPLNATGYPKVGRMAFRLVRRDTGAYVEADLQLDDPAFTSAVGRSPDAHTFPEGCVADVYLTLNGVNFLPTGQNVTFGSRPLFKIAFIYVSAPDDFGWTFQHNSARLQLEKTFFGQIETMIFSDVKEFGPNMCDFCTTMPGWDNKTSNWPEEGDTRLNHRTAVIMRDVIENHGVKLIFATSFWYQGDAYHLAAKYTNVSFVHVSGWLTRPNMAQVFPRIEQARYLSGIAMAWYIKSRNLTKKVGFVSSFPLGETGRAINAVKLGLELVDPDIEIFLTWLLTWHDDRKEAFATKRLIDFYGVEGIAQHTDSRTPQLTARDLGKMGTGYNTDMLLTVGDSVLTSPVFVWAADYTFLVQKLLDGDTDINVALWNGASKGAWRLSDLSPSLPSEATVQIAAELKRFQAGDDTMWCKPNMYDNRGRWRNGPTNPAVNPVPWEAQHLVPGTTCLTDPVINQVCQEYDAIGNCKEIWLLAGVYDSCGSSQGKPQGIHPPLLPAGACFLGPLDIPDQCPPGQILDLLKGCTNARPGFYAAEEIEVPCTEGYYGPEAGLPACLPCQPGKAAAMKNSTECKGCAVGKYADEAAMSQCNPCPRGTYEGGDNATQCTFCPAGTFSDAVGASQCAACPGTMTTHEIASVTAAACVCGLGTYRRADGAGCDACPEGSSTEAIDATDVGFCLCSAGTYMSLDDSCQPCPDTMVCPRGSSERNFALFLGQAQGPEQQYPKLMPRFWSAADAPMSVFECASAEVCVGGDPGEASCGSGLQGQACSHCPEQFVWQGDKCRRCSDLATSRFVFPWLPLLLAPVVITVLYRMFGDTYRRWGSWQNGLAAALFVILNHFQIVSLMRGVDIVIPSAAAHVYDVWGFTDDVVGVFKPACAGLGNFRDSMLIKALGPLILAGLFVVTWCLWLAASKISRRPSVLMEVNRLLNVFFSLIFTFFAGISSMAFTLFKCSGNPNGKRTLIADRSINCFEHDWNGMLAIGICAVVVWCLGFGVLFVWVAYRSPKMFHNPGFQMRWKFLFIKYRPDVHWWALVFVLKGIILNLGFLTMQTAISKIYWIMGCLTAYAVLDIVLLPWRHRWVNILDIWAHLCLLLGSSTLVWFAALSVSPSEATGTSLGVRNLCISVMFIVVPVVFPVIAYLVYWEESARAHVFKRSTAIDFHKLCYHVENMDPQAFVEFVKELGDWDQYHLQVAKVVLAQELCSMRSRSGYSSRELSATSLEDTIKTKSQDSKIDRAVVHV